MSEREEIERGRERGRVSEREERERKGESERERREGKGESERERKRQGGVAAGRETDRQTDRQRVLFVWLVGFLTSSSTTRLYRGQAPRLSFRQYYALPHTRQSWETMTSVSAGHIIRTPTQPPSSRERAATAGIGHRTSSPGGARSRGYIQI